MKIIATSDTHGKHHMLDDIPDGDVLVHAGDFTKNGNLDMVYHFASWLGDQPHDHKIVIAGNHDRCFQNRSQTKLMANSAINDVGVYLQDSSVEIDGVKFYGTPWSITFGNWVFMAGEEELESRYERMDEDTDVLISHGPPYGIQDKIKRSGPDEDPHVGSKALRERIDKVQPEYTIFGHIHEAYGQEKTSASHFINASVLNLKHKIVNDPVVIEI